MNQPHEAAQDLTDSQLADLIATLTRMDSQLPLRGLLFDVLAAAHRERSTRHQQYRALSRLAR